MKTDVSKLQDWLNEAKKITLVSGCGTEGICESYSGSRSIRQMKKVLTIERQGGDRWAHFIVDGRWLDFIKYFGY